MIKLDNIFSALPESVLLETATDLEKTAKYLRLRADELHKRSMTANKIKQQNDAKKLHETLENLFKDRLIMRKLRAGHTYKEIGSALGCHERTIARHVKRITYDTTLLRQIDNDLLKHKVQLAQNMKAAGKKKSEIRSIIPLSSHYLN